MSAEENKAVVHQMLEALNQKDSKVAEDIFAANWVNHDPAFPPLQGIEGARQLLTLLAVGFPDMIATVDDMFAAGDRVGCRFTLKGTHSGDFLGLAPTGRHVSIGAIGVFRVVDGRLTDNWVNLDALGLMQQVGIIPTAGQ